MVVMIKNQNNAVVGEDAVEAIIDIEHNFFQKYRCIY